MWKCEYLEKYRPKHFWLLGNTRRTCQDHFKMSNWSRKLNYWLISQFLKINRWKKWREIRFFKPNYCVFIPDIFKKYLENASILGTLNLWSINIMEWGGMIWKNGPRHLQLSHWILTFDQIWWFFVFSFFFQFFIEKSVIDFFCL